MIYCLCILINQASITNHNLGILSLLWFSASTADLNQINTENHSENFFLNLAKSNHIWTVITLFRLIWHQAEIRLMQNHSEKCKQIWFSVCNFSFTIIRHADNFPFRYTKIVFYNLMDCRNKYTKNYCPVPNNDLFNQVIAILENAHILPLLNCGLFLRKYREIW